MRFSRRRLCGALATTVSVALAGCTNGTGGTGGDDGATTDTPFEGCPSLREADRTVCAASAAADTPVVLRPSATTVEAPETLRFTLSNGGETTFGMNPYDWAVHRETADGWARVAPDATIEPWREVPPGDAQAWVLRVDGEATTTTVSNASTTTSDAATSNVSATASTPLEQDGTIPCGPLDLDTGTYAFSVVAQAADEWTAYVARFRVA